MVPSGPYTRLCHAFLVLSMYCKDTLIDNKWQMWHEFHCTVCIVILYRLQSHTSKTKHQEIQLLLSVYIYIDSFTQSRLLCTLYLKFMKHIS